MHTMIEATRAVAAAATKGIPKRPTSPLLEFSVEEKNLFAK